MEPEPVTLFGYPVTGIMLDVGGCSVLIHDAIKTEGRTAVVDIPRVAEATRALSIGVVPK